MKNREANRRNSHLAHADAQSVPVAQAARTLGLSVRTAKRMCAAGQLEAFKTAGGHLRVASESVESARQGSRHLSSGSTSSAFQRKREQVEVLHVEAQELRARRDIEKLREEDSQVERARTMGL